MTIQVNAKYYLFQAAIDCGTVYYPIQSTQMKVILWTPGGEGVGSECMSTQDFEPDPISIHISEQMFVYLKC